MSHSFGRFSAITMIPKKKHVSNSVELDSKDGPAHIFVASLSCRATGRFKNSIQMNIYPLHQSNNSTAASTLQVLSFRTTHELWITTPLAGQRHVGIFLSFIYPVTDIHCPGSTGWISLCLERFIYFFILENVKKNKIKQIHSIDTVVSKRGAIFQFGLRCCL